MRFATMALATVIAVAAPAAAQATVVFQVTNGVAGGGTLVGSFETNDAITMVTKINLTTSANGKFDGMTYSTLANVTTQSLPNSFKITVTGNGNQTNTLQLNFNPSLTANGSAIASGSTEFQSKGNAGDRAITGNVSVMTAVPEPATWAMMLLGFGAVGGAARYRRRKTNVAFA